LSSRKQLNTGEVSRPSSVIINNNKAQMSHAQLPPAGGVGGNLLAPSGGGVVGGAASGMLREREVVRITGKQAIVSFLESQTCFSVLRASGKVVVFDTRIPIQLAFYALVEHGEL
jgi:hypothetical protein